MACTHGTLLLISAGWITQIYNTEVEVRNLAAAFMRALALCMPFQAMANVSYFAMRSTGKILLTMAFDCIYIWVFCVPYTYALVTFTSLGIETLYPSTCSSIHSKRFSAWWWSTRDLGEESSGRKGEASL